jgi:hypothetical protein
VLAAVSGLACYSSSGGLMWYVLYAETCTAATNSHALLATKRDVRYV